MVCFSEYYTGTIDNKNITYGKYGIGFKDNWIKRKKIHEVLYVERDSIIAEALASLLRARRKKAEVQLSEDVRDSIITIKCFTKNTVGYNSYFNVPNFIFRNENEFRYVPTKQQIKGNLISCSKTKYLAKKDFYNQKLLPYSLKFSLSDLRFIFVETEEQKEEIMQMLPFQASLIIISNWSTDLKKQVTH